MGAAFSCGFGVVTTFTASCSRILTFVLDIGSQNYKTNLKLTYLTFKNTLFLRNETHNLRFDTKPPKGKHTHNKYNGVSLQITKI
jgi:hypothetical protein